MNRTEAPSVTAASEEIFDPSRPSLPPRIQKHLGALLAGVCTPEIIEPGSTNLFADLLAKLELALGQAHDCNDFECHQLLLAATPALRRFALSLAHDPLPRMILYRKPFYGHGRIGRHLPWGRTSRHGLAPSCAIHSIVSIENIVRCRTKRGYTLPS